MPSPTVILGILLAVALVALAGSGALLKASWEREAALAVQYERQRAETAAAKAEIKSLKAQHTLQLEVRGEQDKERSREIAGLKRQTRDVERTRDSLSQALRREPERAGRVVSIIDARSVRDICRASGGSAAACKIELPKPAATGRRDPADDPVGPGQGVGGKEPAAGRPIVHPKSGLR